MNPNLHFYSTARSGHHAIIHWAIDHEHIPLYELHEFLWNPQPVYPNPHISNTRYAIDLEQAPITSTVTPSHNYLNVLILRDVYNTYASILQRHEMWHRIIELTDWKSRAKEALNLTHHLNNKVVILYNHWLNPHHQPEIAEQLQITPTPQPTRPEGGIHFTDQNTAQRYLTWTPYQLYRNLFDPETITLNQQLFNFTVDFNQYPLDPDFQLVTIPHGQTLFNLFGPAWQQIYNHPKNHSFRSLHPDPNQIGTHSYLFVPTRQQPINSLVMKASS